MLSINVRKIITNVLLSVTFFASCPLSAFADNYNVVYFYANWNFASRKAGNIIKEAIKDYQNVSFNELDIDALSTHNKAKQLGVFVPDSVPYYFLVDEDKDILIKKKYQNENASELKQIFEKKIK